MKKIFFLLLTSISLLLSAEYKNITALEAYDMQQNGSLLVDVRSLDEHNYEHPADSKLVQLFFDSKSKNFNDNFLDEFNIHLKDGLDSEVIIICRSGSRTKWLSDQLVKLGYKNIYNVEKGFIDWKRSKLPTSR